MGFTCNQSYLHVNLPVAIAVKDLGKFPAVYVSDSPWLAVGQLNDDGEQLLGFHDAIFGHVELHVPLLHLRPELRRREEGLDGIWALLLESVDQLRVVGHALDNLSVVVERKDE